MPSQSRRRFLASSAIAAGVVSTPASFSQAASVDGDRQYYEWRTYRTDNPSQQERVLRYLESAAMPGWKKSAIGPVGVFTETGDGASSHVHVLLTYQSLDAAAGERSGLEANSDYAQAAANYSQAGKDDPAFARIDSTLLVAFAGQPQIQLPGRRPRVLELRTYQSHSEAKARRKIEMFNAGEIPIFRKAGFETVFFGESLFGPDLPNLKYLVAAADMAANAAGWKAFREHPDWVAMKDLPQYADTVSHIDKLYLIPTAFSEI